MKLSPSGDELRPPSSGWPAFTLLELLTVIGIIGLLAALLLPALSSARNRGSQTVDVNNLRQLITATHLYATDNGDVLPWPNWRAGDLPNRPGWLYTIDPLADGPDQFKVETGLFWEALQSSKLYLCPMDKPDDRFSMRQQQISSYVMNGAIIGYHRRRYPPLRLSQFRPDAVAFWETDERFPYYFNDGSSFPSEGVSARHRKGAIHASFGGAVQYIKLADWNHEADATNRNRLWCYPDSPGGW